MTDSGAGVVGRYAPSPTGDLHFGSLIAALASYCDAKAAGGRWLLRIDDLDTPRVVPGAADRIIDQLAMFGMVPDGPILYQSERHDAYIAAIERLKTQGDAFDCGCTRREAQSGRVGPEGPIYPGTCRDGLPAGRSPRSVRLRTRDTRITVDDQVQGPITQNLGQDIGDFVIRRADGIAAYQLATVLDDAAQGITRVARGADLLLSSPRQRYLQQRLELPETDYLHVPLIIDADGDKLGKSNGALALDDTRAGALIRECLGLLGQPIAGDDSCDVAKLIENAVAAWDHTRIPRQRMIRRQA